MKSQTLRDGLIVGLIAYAAVALFYAVFDILAARGTLYTVNLLGQAVFRGWRDPSVLGFPMQPDVWAIAAYNALHLVVSLAIGFIVTALVARSEEQPSQGRQVLVTIVAGFVITIVAVGLLTRPIRSLLPWWSIVVANVLAVVVAGMYFLRTHPGIWHRLTASPR
jgi:hypothetical protein